MRARLSGAEIEYEIVGDGPRLVWSHGLASCRESDRAAIDVFAGRFTVLAYDARGHGFSPPVRRPSGYSYELLSKDLRELMEEVGWPDAVLVGLSMGSATVIRAAMEAPSVARAVVMARPGSSGGPASETVQALFRLGATAIRSGGLDGAVSFLMTIPQAREHLEGDPGRLEDLKRDWSRHDPESIAAALETIPGLSPMTAELDATAITAPVLVIPGNDLMHPLEAGVRCAEAIPGARLASPLDPRRDANEQLVETVVAFLEEAGALDDPPRSPAGADGGPISPSRATTES